MKVSCDFLPHEHKSFLLATKALVVAIVMLVASLASCLSFYRSYLREISVLEKEVNEKSGELAKLDSRLNSITYDQAKIKELITKFQFIQTAMGATDYPYLRFFQSLEDALPRGAAPWRETTSPSPIDIDPEELDLYGMPSDPSKPPPPNALKRIQITRLQRSGDTYSISGVAKEDRDITNFEKALKLTTYEEAAPSASQEARPSRKRNNFSDVKVFKLSSDNDKQYWNFEMQFRFLR